MVMYSMDIHNNHGLVLQHTCMDIHNPHGMDIHNPHGMDIHLYGMEFIISMAWNS